MEINCCCSVAKSCLTLCDPTDYSTPGFPVLHRLSEFAQTHVHWISDAIQPSHSLWPPLSPAPNLSQHQSLFQRVGSLYQVAKVFELQLQHQSFQISFRIDWFDLLAVQGILKSLLQHRRSKASVLQGSAFFMIQLLHPYMTTGKTIALTRWTFVSKVMSRFVIAFRTRSKRLLFLWLQSPPAVILEPKNIKFHYLDFIPIYLSWSDGTDDMISVFRMVSFKPAFSLSSFTLIKRVFSFSSLSDNRVVLSAYLRLLIFLLAISIPACDSTSQHFAWYTRHMLNK